MIERTGLTQQLVTGRQAQGEGGLPESRAPQVPASPVFTVSRGCLEFKPSTYLHWEPTNASGRVGQGVVIKAKNQTQTRPDQSMGAASGPGLTSLGCTFLGLPPVIFLQGQFSLNSTPQDCQDPTSKAGCHQEPWKAPFSMPRAALLNTRPYGKEGHSFIHWGLN